MLQRLAPVRYVVGNAFDVKVGQRLDLDAEKRRLESAGYRHVPQVFDPGDFAVRGGLLDVYPMGADEPYRVELFDDEIDSIRGFDPETQRSLDKVDAVQLLPGREVPLDEDALKRAMQTLRDRFDIDTRRSALFQDLKAGLAPAGIEYYLPIFFDHTATLFDYLGERVLPIVCDGALACADAFWSQTAERYEQRRHDIERPLLPPNELYLPPDGLRELLNLRSRVDVVGGDEAKPRRRRPWAINRRRTCRWPRATPPRAR
jgi:transcription-repair coupling factor (superfamily II helicase)